VRARGLKLWTIDGDKVAQDVGMGGRINTIMQTCFFALSGVLPRDEADEGDQGRDRPDLRQARRHRARAQPRRGRRRPAAPHEAPVPAEGEGLLRRRAVVPQQAPDFVQRVTAMIMEGDGDRLPVSAFPVDGTYPTDTARWEKRSIAHEVPVWESDICTQCTLCALACPHAAIRVNAVPEALLDGAPDGFKSVAWRGKDAALEGSRFIVQLAPDDCTGCGVCVDVCPARDKRELKRKAINMQPKAPVLDDERAWWDFFRELPLPRPDFDELDPIKASQLRETYFEFSGACAGCGETPYVKLLSQLYGDHLVVANATGCSSIYGANLPTTPWSQDGDGRGPAWSNSLFEDAAEFGYGMRLAVDARASLASQLVTQLRPRIGAALADEILLGQGRDDAAIAAQRERVERLRAELQRLDDDPTTDAAERAAGRRLAAVAEALVPRQVWVIGGDGWAYDIGFGGLDHVLASGRDVNILVLDTEVYSNTGGQASKSTPRAAVAKFAASGKSVGKKDLGQIAMAYGDVYVAQISMGASPKQAIEVLRAAAAWPGPSLVIAYSPCIAHGIDMSTMMGHQRDAVRAGYLMLYHYDPQQALHEGGGEPLVLDSRPPTKPLAEWAAKEGRFAVLARSQPERAEALMKLAEADAKARRFHYEQLAGMHREVPDKAAGDAARALATPVKAVEDEA
jgi:pyruvate-ferredoxin/flavodoxin oxidoreductase